MTREEVRVGLPIWGQCGSTGWRPGVVVKIGRERDSDTRIYVRYETGTMVNGVRFPRELRPRNPSLRGKDKPQPPWKEEAAQ